MALRFIEQKPENQVSEMPAAVFLQDADAAQPEGTVLPPDAAGGYGNRIRKDKNIPAFRILSIRAEAENRFTYRQKIGEIIPGSEPFTLNHIKTPYESVSLTGITDRKDEVPMDKKKIERINELARKKKAGGLTAEEAEEQAALRHEYLAEYRENMKAMLDNLVIQEQDGTRHALKQKDNPAVQ